MKEIKKNKIIITINHGMIYYNNSKTKPEDLKDLIECLKKAEKEVNTWEY